MDEMTFNTTDGQEIDRDLLVLCLNVGDSSAPVWAPIGCGVEDSTAEYDWQRESKKDIIGHTHNTMKKPIITQTFDPWPLRTGDEAQKWIWDKAVRDQDAQALANADCLLLHKYAGTAKTALFAERYESTSIEMTGLGGEGGGYLAMPITVTFGGVRTVGTASAADGVIKFT